MRVAKRRRGAQRRSRGAGIALLALWLASCGGEDAGAGRSPGAPVSVETFEVALDVVRDSYEAVGTIRPRVSAKVASQVMATIESVAVEPGDAVAAGQLLAALDDRDLRAEYDRARADHDRFRRLLEKNAVTQAELDAVESRFRVAQAALSYAEIRAPFAGIVVQKLCDAGDMAVPGKSLFEIEGANAFRVETPVPERFGRFVSVGTPTEVSIDATGERCSGSIGEVVPSADAKTRSVLVKIDAACREPLQTGGFARAHLTVGERPALTVPPAALQRTGQLTFVYAIRDRRAAMRLVKLGPALGERVEVLSGLEPGDRVVVHAARELADGQLVEERAPDAAPPALEGSG
ncbi:MAG: efflux RND transporter periplasmic adaptor subunit [Myxococcales bacterium]|nr:efflux RND transporter periplasmic adaptor subunit [Myxococcales bacterium]MDH5567312.1 efflux RND transporter periplasmic adaptor subunit [Myxococcales bacterium]